MLRSLRLRGPAAPALAAGVGAPLPGGLLRGLRRPRRVGSAQEARPAARLRDRPGRLRGPVRSTTPAGLAARAHGGDRTTRRERRLSRGPARHLTARAVRSAALCSGPAARPRGPGPAAGGRPPPAAGAAPPPPGWGG